MTNYSNSKIYEIICRLTEERYIGSTTETLSRRLAYHRLPSNECSSRQIIERGDFYINLLEDCPCENKDQLRKKEREWYDKLDCINKNRPFTSKEEKVSQKKEYYEQNKDKVSEKTKEYREQNKDKVAEYQKEYRKQNKETVAKSQKEYREQNKETVAKQKKEYYEQNKDKVAEKTKEYREQNKAKIAKNQKEYREQNKEKIAAKQKEKYALKKQLEEVL